MNPQQKDTLRAGLERLAKNRDDSEAWRTVFLLTWAAAVATANRVLRGVLELAEDAAQEAFFSVLRYANFKRITDPDAFVSYLKAISRNAALDMFRMLSTHTNRSQSDEDLVATEPSDALPSPEETYLARELYDNFGNHLAAEDRLLLDLLVDGYTVGAVSEKLNISYSAAGVRIHRFRERLRNYLKDKKM